MSSPSSKPPSPPSPSSPPPRSSCLIGGREVPVTASSSFLTSQDLLDRAVTSDPFKNWVANMDRSVVAQRARRHQTEGGGGGDLEVKSVEVQSVDLFGSRVGFVKIKAHCTMDGRVLPGVCLLRGMSVGVLVVLRCIATDTSGRGGEEAETYSILVEQPRIPIGEARMLEIPAGMIDGESGNFTGVAAAELEEECGITVNERDLVDLTALAYGGDGDREGASSPGICPSGGGCDEYVRLMYLERSVTKEWIDSIRGRLAGLREHGELITLRVVRFDDVWRETCDAKALCALHLLSQLRKSGKLEPLGTPLTAGLAHQLHPVEDGAPATTMTTEEGPRLTMSDGTTVPQLAFGLYKVAPDECDEAIAAAVRAGYRHFDSASAYGNEAAVGRALRRCGVPREELFIGGKVWNDAQRAGRAAVRESFEMSLRDLDCDYLDVFYVHWPVPGHHTETYKELELLHVEGKIRSLGISNYTPQDYEELLASGITVKPVLNQIEASPHSSKFLGGATSFVNPKIP